MADNSLQQRVFAIEQMLQDYATRRHLERVERELGGQIVQLRTEMRSEFAAMRDDVRAGDEGTRRGLGDEIRAGDEETRSTLSEEIRRADESVRGLIEQRTVEILALVNAGDEGTRRLMRVLHEAVIERINTIARG